MEVLSVPSILSAFGDDPRAADLTFEIGDKIIRERPDVLNPPWSVVAVGLSAVSFDAEAAARKRRVIPTIYVPLDVHPAAPRTPEHLEGRNDALAQLLDGIANRAVAESFAWAGIRRPKPFAAPGEVADAAHPGTFGPLVADAGNRECILTAGHVVESVGQVVHDVSGQWGVASYVMQPGPPLESISADTAFVVPDHSPARISNGLVITSAGSATALSRVTLYTRRGSFDAVVDGALYWLHLEGFDGLHGHLYKMIPGRMQGGDSGGPVMLTNSSTVIGTIVGGDSEATYAQDIRYQLNEIGSSLVPSH